MKPFFNCEDFNNLQLQEIHFLNAGPLRVVNCQKICDAANAKLERFGEVVIGSRAQGFQTIPDNQKWHTHKGLLINLEFIEQPSLPKEPTGTCEHPIESISGNILKGFECECGAKVEPTNFQAIK